MQETKDENDKKVSKENPDLEETLSSLGIEAKEFVNEFGIDPSRIRSYRVTKDGNAVFLCADENEQFYILRASPKNTSWGETVGKYRRED